MSIQHTPGPWFASCDNDDTEVPNAITAKDGTLIATVEDDDRIVARHRRGRSVIGDESECDARDEVDANARLIAAAPDMLAVLKAIVAVHDAYGPGILRRESAAARKAIAKACGDTTYNDPGKK